jgi:hypothetical protein
VLEFIVLLGYHFTNGIEVRLLIVLPINIRFLLDTLKSGGHLQSLQARIKIINFYPYHKIAATILKKK